MKKETNVKEFLMKYGFVIILILVTAFFGITTNNFITVKNLFSNNVIPNSCLLSTNILLVLCFITSLFIF